MGQSRIEEIMALVGAALSLWAVIPYFEAMITRRRIRTQLRDTPITSAQKREAPALLLGKLIPVQSLATAILYGSLGGLLGLFLITAEPISTWAPLLRILVLGMTIYIGFRLPAMRAERQQKLRRNMIEKDLPSVIDLLILMLDAGASFDDAIRRLVEDRRSPRRVLVQEFSKLLQELNMSPDRQSAFQKFAALDDVADLRLFSSVLVQSELYGTPVSQGLRGLAYEIRERQFHAVEAASNALGPKLTVPMTIFFLPLIFIVVLAPTIIRAFHLS